MEPPTEQVFETREQLITSIQQQRYLMATLLLLYHQTQAGISPLVVIEAVSTAIEFTLRMAQSEEKQAQSELAVPFNSIGKSLLIINGKFRLEILPITMSLTII